MSQSSDCCAVLVVGLIMLLKMSCHIFFLLNDKQFEQTLSLAGFTVVHQEFLVRTQKYIDLLQFARPKQ
jgi:hypothetical protein